MPVCMFLKNMAFLLFLLIFLLHQKPASSSSGDGRVFTFNGFKEANLTLDGSASIDSGGRLMLTNSTKHTMGHALYPSPIHFRALHNGSSVFSFSTTFVFAITPKNDMSGNGLAFFISHTNDFSRAHGMDYLGLFNSSNDGDSGNHVFAVELDTIFNDDLKDIDENHVGIDINSIKSNQSDSAGYFIDDTGKFVNLSLSSGEARQVWVDYDGERTQLYVTLAPFQAAKPRKPLLSVPINLSSVFADPMYVGFSAALGSFQSPHYILGWSFKMNGTAPALDYRLLPSLLPRLKTEVGPKHFFYVGLPLALAVLIVAMVAAFRFIARRRKYAEVLEDWEKEFGPHRFSYRDLFRATKGFAEEELLGMGGFGGVYKGVLPSSKEEVAVKRVSHESRQGMREFVAEIASLGHLRHRNLVKLLGYCRRKGELLLVYEYMPSGSLDKFLFDHSRAALDWATRIRIVRGVAEGLLYLHEDWEQVVIHRDIKAGNVLLDKELNGKLGDFGLARLYDHGNDPFTTRVVGTMGYLAPELGCTGKANTATDVFAFGIFLLEVACGRRPMSHPATKDGEPLVLADWVAENWRKGSMLATRDPRLGEEYAAEEVELVLKLGLLCSHPVSGSRPGMRRVVQWLERDAPPPELSAEYFYSGGGGALVHGEDFSDYVISYPSSSSLASAITGGR